MDIKNSVAPATKSLPARILAGVIALALTMAGLIGFAAPAPANAVTAGGPGPATVVGYDSVFYVNDLRNRATGTVITLPTPPGGSAPVQSLTLFDAVQRANALPAGERVLITVADHVWVPNQDTSNPPAWITPSDAANPAGTWQKGSAASPLLIKVLQAEDPGFATSVGVAADAEMLRGAAWTTQMGGNTSEFSSATQGSRYFISHDNVTVDLQRRIGFNLSSDTVPPGSLFAIRGDNVTIRNISALASAESGIIISAFSDGTIIENSSLGNPSVPVAGAASSTSAIERAIEIFEGASNTLIRNVVFDRNNVAAVTMLRATTRGEVANLTLDGVNWKQTPSASSNLSRNYLLATGSTGVSSTAGADSSGLRILNSTVSDWCADSTGGNLGIIDLEYSTHKNAVISGNTFNGSSNCAVNAIQTLRSGTGTSIDISNNTFRTTASMSTLFTNSWVYIDDVALPAASNTTKVSIHDNTISGGGNSALITMDPYPLSRVLSVYRNAMNGIGGTPTAANENGLKGENPIYTWNVNNSIRTAFPAAAPTVSGCIVSVNIVAPSLGGAGGNAPTTDTLWVDVYVGDTPTDLDSYVGRVVVNAAALQAAGAAGLPYQFPFTGSAGYVRLQTMLDDSNPANAAIGQTSNISRSIKISGSDVCAPQMWVKQGGWFDRAGSITAAQSDPTANRLVNFEISSSELIADGQLTPEDIGFVGTAVNQQVVSLTQVSATLWQLVAKADGSGTIIPTIAAGAVADPTGNLQAQAANTTVAPVNVAGFTDTDELTGIAGDQIDRSVAYVAPLVLTKMAASVTEAKTGAVSDSFGVGYLDDSASTGLITDANARILTAPTQPLQVCLSNGGDFTTGDSVLNPLAPAQAITAAADVKCADLRTTDTAGSISVTAVDNLVLDGTRTANSAGVGSSADGSNMPSFVVNSDDPQFAGLLLGPETGFQTSLTVNDNDQPSAADSDLALTTNGALANGTDINVVTATVHNATDDPVSNAPVLFDIPLGVTWVGPDGAPGTPDDVVGGVGVTATVVTGASGESVFVVTSATAESYPLSARVNGSEPIQSSPLDVTFVALAVDLTKPGTGFTVSAGDQVANGSADHTITVTLRTVADTPAQGFASSLAATTAPNSGVVVGSFTETATPGEYTASVTSTVSGLKTIAVTFDDGSVQSVPLISGGSETASFVAGPPIVGPGFSGVTIDDSAGRLANGIAFHEIKVTLADAQTNPVAGAAARLTSAVAGAPASVSISPFIESATMPGTYTALVRSTSSGGKDVTVSFDGALTLGMVTANFAAGAVDLGNLGSRYSVSTGDEVVGTGSHTVTVTLSDSNGNAVPGQAGALTATSADPLGTGVITAFVETGTAGTYTATITSTVAGDQPISVRFSNAAVTLSGNGLARFVPDVVDLTNTGTSYTVSGGDVTVGVAQHAVTVLLADQYGNAVSGEASQLLAETVSGLGTGSVTVFTETAIPGRYQALVSSTISGGKPMTATFNGDALTLSGNDVASFIPDSVDLTRPGTRVTVSTGDQTVGTGTHTITVTLVDEFDNDVENQELGLESTTAALLGSGSITQFTETAPGTYEATITSTISGDKTLVTTFGADVITVLESGNDTARFVPGPVDLSAGASGFFVSPGSVLVGTGQHSATVHLQDSFGNAVSGRDADILATASGLGAGSITSFSETGTPGTYTATVTSTLAGAKALSVTLGIDAVLADGNSEAAFNAAGVDLSAPGSGYSVSGGSVSVAGGSHEVTVTLTDQYGNPVAAQAALLNGTSTAPLGGGSVGNFVEGPTGTYTSTIVSTLSGDKPILVTLVSTPVTLLGNGDASFIAGGVDLGNAGTRYSVSAGSQTVGTGTHTITVTLADDQGNEVPGQSAGLQAFAAGSIGAGTLSTFTETATSGTYTATVSSTLAGAKSITVQFGASQIVLGGNGAALFAAGAVDPANVGTGFSVSSGQVSVIGGSHQITATLADGFGNAVSGQDLLLLGDTVEALGTGIVSPFLESAIPGTYVATVTSSVAGDKTAQVDFDANAMTLRGNGTASFVAGGVDVTNPGTRFSVSSGDQLVGSGIHTITVTLADAEGNAVSGQAGGLSSTSAESLGTGGLSVFSETGTPGTYTATVSSTVSGAKDIAVSFGASALSASGNRLAAFVSAGVDLSNSASNYAVSLGTASVAGGTHTVLVSMADQFGNAVSGVAADLDADTLDPLGTGSISPFVETATPGTYTATVTSSLAGTKSVTSTYLGSAITLSGNAGAIFSSGSVDVGAAGTRFSVSTGDELAGTGTHTITVTLGDSYGNAVGGQAALLGASSAAGLGTGSVSVFVETATPGTYTATVTSTLAGAKQIEVLYGQGVVSPTGDVVTAGGNDTASFVAAAVDPTNPNTVFSVSTGDQPVVTGSHSVTVVLVDQFENAVSGQATNLVATTADDLGSGASSSFSETVLPGTYVATVTSTVSGAKTMAVLFDGVPLAASGNTEAVFIAGEPDLTNPGSVFTVTTGDQVVGSGSHTVTVTLADGSGNAAPGRAALLTATTTALLGTGAVSGFVETATPGQYTATVTSTISGGKALVVRYDGNLMTASGNTSALFVAGVVDPGNSNTSYVVSGGSVLVGTGSHLITARLADQFGNAVSGRASGLQATSPDPLGSGATSVFVETATAGTYEATVTSSNAGSKDIVVELDGVPVLSSGNTIAVFAPGSVDPSDPGTAFSVSTGSQPVGSGSHTITVTLTDSETNIVSGQEAGISASVPGIGAGVISPFTETATLGTYSATVSSTSAGAKTVTVRFGADPLTANGNDRAAFTSGGVDPGHPQTGFVVTSGSQVVGTGLHTVTVKLADQYGNEAAGFESDLTAATTGNLGSGAIGTFSETATPGTYTATISSTLSGSKVITVNFDTAPVLPRGNATAIFEAGPFDPASSQLEATPLVRADGVSTSTITLRLFDAFGNPVTQRQTVGYSSTIGSLGPVTFDGNGVYMAVLTSTAAGRATVSVTIGSIALDLTVEVEFTDVTPPEPPIVDPSNGKTVTGCAEPGSTVTVRDEAGKVIGTGVVGDDCRFTVELDPAQKAGSKISVTATDSEGNVSRPTVFYVGLISMDLTRASLQQGETQIAFGYNFQPGEQISAVLRSDPISLGIETADEDGQVIFTFQIPDNLEPGSHSVTLTGGFSGSVSENFTVDEVPKLVNTGSDLLIPLFAVGVLALIGGAYLFGLRRRGVKGIEEPTAP